MTTNQEIEQERDNFDAWFDGLPVDMEGFPCIGGTRINIGAAWLGWQARAKGSRETSSLQPVGVTSYMPGTDGFTMAAFKATDVPIETRLYTQPNEKWKTQSWKTGEPPVDTGLMDVFLVAVHRQGIPGLPYVFSAIYVKDFRIPFEGNMEEGIYLTGWYQLVSDEFVPLLSAGDVLRGWMEFPEWTE